MNSFKLSTLALAATLALGAGCASDHSSSSQRNPAGIFVEPSSREIVAGETVTLVARTRDTYGRDAKIEWSSTAGSLKTEQDGRIARVRFDQTGTYTVRAALHVDGREVEHESVVVRVKPVG